MVILCIALILLILLLCALAIFFAIPFLFGAPFDITRKTALKNIVKLTNPKSADKIAELGSGDGRVCIALAKKSHSVLIHGFEINPFLVLISRRKIKQQNLQNQIKIYWKNFWNVNLSKYNKIVLFQYKTIMKRLENKLNNELKSNKKSKKTTKIISHNWKFPNLKPKKQLGQQHLLEGIVYLYEK